MESKKDTRLLSVLGSQVRQARTAARLTLQNLSEQSGLSPRFLSDVEAGRANISILNLAELSRVLQVPLVELITPLSEAKSTPKVVSLLGLRGAGKSTVGTALARRMGVEFFELDQLVEREAGMSLSEIFAIHGEGYFRQLELEMLKRFLRDNPEGVLATGGGLVSSPEAFSLCLSQTRSVWLKATPEEHWKRVVQQGDLRPMKDRPQAMTELRRRLKEREPQYRQAQTVCSTSGRAIDAIVDELAESFS